MSEHKNEPAVESSLMHGFSVRCDITPVGYVLFVATGLALIFVTTFLKELVIRATGGIPGKEFYRHTKVRGQVHDWAVVLTANCLVSWLTPQQMKWTPDAAPTVIFFIALIAWGTLGYLWSKAPSSETKEHQSQEMR